MRKEERRIKIEFEKIGIEWKRWKELMDEREEGIVEEDERREVF